MRIQEKVTYVDLDSISVAETAPPLKLNLGKVNFYIIIFVVLTLDHFTGPLSRNEGNK